jgi:hypothetical protein
MTAAIVDIDLLKRVAHDDAFQAALRSYALGNGSSQAIALAALVAAGAFRTRLALKGSEQALRSYQYGNAGTELAKAMADIAEAALAFAPQSPIPAEIKS